jgi:hypothetical protein
VRTYPYDTNYDEMIETARKHLEEEMKAEREVLDAARKEVAQLEEIVTIAISACRDHSPFLAEVLLQKAEIAFGKSKH